MSAARKTASRQSTSGDVSAAPRRARMKRGKIDVRADAADLRRRSENGLRMELLLDGLREIANRKGWLSAFGRTDDVDLEFAIGIRRICRDDKPR